ncbi:MAG: chemotaxis protein CheB [Nitrosospira sp.]|nr:chemotaxis protein CheB [Nitrosospira sp.]
MTQADEKKSTADVLPPSQPGSLPLTSASVKSELPDAQPTRDLGAGQQVPFPIVGVGASAGGVEALQKFFDSLPANRGIAYIVVVHLAPDHPSHLAEILSKCTSMAVLQVGSDVAVEPDKIYVIPPNHYLTFSDGRIHLQPMSHPRALPQAIDRLFISLAEDQQERAIGIVLTGANHDGTVGLKAIKAAGGIVIAQLPATAQHPSMPQSAVETGLVDYVLAVEEMGHALLQYIDRSSLWRWEQAPESTEEEARALRKIVALVSTRGGGDFRGYKEC